MAKPEPTPLPHAAFTYERSPGGFHEPERIDAYTADQMRAHAASRDAEWQAKLDAAVAQEREACAEVCESRIDDKEGRRAQDAANSAIKSKAGIRKQLDRLEHESAVALFNSVLRQCAAAIRARTQGGSHG